MHGAEPFVHDFFMGERGMLESVCKGNIADRLSPLERSFGVFSPWPRLYTDAMIRAEKGDVM